MVREKKYVRSVVVYVYVNSDDKSIIAKVVVVLKFVFIINKFKLVLLVGGQVFVSITKEKLCVFHVMDSKYATMAK